jgi:hypothetical protein
LSIPQIILGIWVRHYYPQNRVACDDEKVTASSLIRLLPARYLKFLPVDRSLYSLSRVDTLSDNYVRVKYPDFPADIFFAVLE